MKACDNLSSELRFRQYINIIDSRFCGANASHIRNVRFSADAVRYLFVYRDGNLQ